MTLAIIISAILGVSLLVAVVTILGRAVALSRVDERRSARAVHRYHLRDRRRPSSAPRPRTSWAPKFDAS